MGTRALHIIGRLWIGTTLLLAAAWGQSFNTNLEMNAAAWQICVLPNCQPGGSGIPTETSISETGSKWPSNSLELSVTGPAWTNLLIYTKVGATSATYFQSDFWVLIPTAYVLSNYQALEYDIFQFLSPYRFMFGSQCVLNAKWQVWDELHQNWIDTSRACAITENTWHHIQWWVHRVDGDTSCDGYPCMHYDMLGVDGTYSQFETAEPAGPIPVGWGDNSGINFQIDITGVTGDRSAGEYIQHVNLVETGG